MGSGEDEFGVMAPGFWLALQDSNSAMLMPWFGSLTASL